MELLSLALKIMPNLDLPDWQKRSMSVAYQEEPELLVFPISALMEIESNDLAYKMINLSFSSQKIENCWQGGLS